MNERCMRIGTVSSIDYDNALVSVTYPQYDGATTAKMPLFSFTDEYKPPVIGSEVLVFHDEAGAAAGVILGRRWNKKNRCDHTGKGVFRKELAPSDSYSKAFLDYDDDSGLLTIHAPKVRIEASEGACDIDSDKVAIRSDLTTNTGDYTTPMDVVASDISLKGHTHTGVHGETSPPH